MKVKNLVAKKPAKVIAYRLSDLGGANDCLREIGEMKREVGHEEAKLASQVAIMNAELETKLLPTKKRIKTLESALKRYANVNRKTLTADGAKTIKLASGEFGWRTSPTRVVLGDQEDKVLTTLEELKLNKYIRIIRELDREAVLRDRPSVAGITFAQSENFFLKPNEVFLEGERQVV